jgi:hypothetical protein
MTDLQERRKELNVEDLETKALIRNSIKEINNERISRKQQ